MGVTKKAPLVGSSPSIRESGSSVIEGDRSLLSHYRGPSGTQPGTLSVITRKSAALRRSLVAKGLAKEYVEQKAREENYRARVPRYQRQRKIIADYQRQQEQHKIKDEIQPEIPEDSEEARDEDTFSDDVVLVMPKRTASAPIKPSSRPSTNKSPVVPPRGATNFSRYSSLRQLREHQDQLAENGDDANNGVSAQGTVTTGLKLSPSEADLPTAPLRPIPRPLSCTRLRARSEIGPKAGAQKLSGSLGGSAPWLSAANRSSRTVLCELAITKDVMMREQLVRQLKEALPNIEKLAFDFLKCQDDHKVAQSTLEAAKAFRTKKSDSLIGLTLTSPQGPDAQLAVVKAERAIVESNTQLVEFVEKMRHHLHHVGILITGAQQATLSIVEGIMEWRRMRQQRCTVSNFQRLFRFPWRRQKIANYMLHLDEDLRVLYPSVVMELLLGPKATYNPLLLPQPALQLVGISSIGKTFLTEREAIDGTTAISSSKKRVRGLRGRDQASRINDADLRQLRGALSNSTETSHAISAPIATNSSSFDLDRLRRCLEAIYQEVELEAQEKQRNGEEEHRFQSTYDPFSTIKFAGGVEETIINVIALQSPTSHQLGEQLRHRQEDTTRVTKMTPQSIAGQPDKTDAPTEVLRLNTERLRLFLEKRAAFFEPAANCELRDVHRSGMKSKLQGKIMVRKTNEKRIEHYLARKIQHQYLVHRQRNALTYNLSRFVEEVRVSVVNIQRVFRGHRAKAEYNCMRNAWLEHQRRVNAVRTIVNSFRRHKRHQHHRRSMTVESVAQAQLICILTHKLNDSADAQETADRYRRVGEERRRQRIVLLQKHKMEQQELERKRNAAAVRMQSVVRSHIAQGQVNVLRQERKAHMTAVSAMAIQSTIRKFLNNQQERRQRFRKDLERVNQSAVRIQSIYRGYNSRASLLGELDKKTRQALNGGLVASVLHEVDTDNEDDEVDEDEEDSASSVSDKDEDMRDDQGIDDKAAANHLPRIIPATSRPSSSKSTSFDKDGKVTQRSSTPTAIVSLPPLYTRDGSSSSIMSTASSSGTGRRISVGMTRVELKLKEAEIGDNFDAQPSRRNSLVGQTRRQT